jgi:hypothetical protein
MENNQLKEAILLIIDASDRHGAPTRYRADKIMEAITKRDKSRDKQIALAAQMEIIQTISNKLVDLDIPVLDYHSDDGYSAIGYYLADLYKSLKEQQDKTNGVKREW